jgi:uncharacterized protein (DUF2141 family)
MITVKEISWCVRKPVMDNSCVMVQRLLLATCLVFLLLSMVVPLSAFAGDTISVSVTVSGLRNNDGRCRLLVFHQDEGFPDEPEHAVLMMNVNIHDSTADFKFTLPAGIYAIGVLHDENANGKVDKKWWGPPKEGVGASNNPKIRWGPPKFDESAVHLDAKNNALKITVNYF